MSASDPSAAVSSGVEALIHRLRDEGVAHGRGEAERIVADAKAHAQSLVREARAEAERIQAEARAEVERMQQSGEEALQVATRDALLALKRTLTDRFAGEVRRIVADEMKKSQFLQRLILQIAGRLREDAEGAQKMEVILPREVVGLEELRKHPEELEEGALTQFVRAIGRKMLREGISFGIAQDDEGGLRLYLEEDEITLDMSDRAVAEALLQHLQPRFRALLEGIVS